MNERRPRAAAAVAAVLLLFCGSARAGVPWRNRLNRAERLSWKQKNAESLQAAENVLADAEKELAPNSPELGHVLARLSRVYAIAGDARRLGAVERRLTALEPKDFEMLLALGIALHVEERFLDAEAVLKKALAFRPDDLEALRELGVVDEGLGRDAEAAALYESAIKRGPRSDLYVSLARCDMRLGRLKEAKEAFARAKTYAPTKTAGKSMIDAYVQEGYFHMALGEDDQAEKDFESGIAADTANALGYHHMGSYLSMRHRLPEAEKYFRLALDRLEADPSAKTEDFLHTLCFLGNVVLAQERPAEAEAIYRRCADKTAPSVHYVKCFMALGRLYADQGKNAEAEKVFKRAGAECGEGSACNCRGMALIGLGNLYVKQGRRSEAADMADRTAKLCEAYQRDPSMLFDLAQLYVGLGSIPKGEEFYARILAQDLEVKFDSVLPLAQGGMAGLRAAQGRFQEAEVLYRRAIALLDKRRDEKDEAAMFDGLAAVYEKEGKPGQAAEARDKSRALSRLLPTPPSFLAR